jgi:hypothetical protein
MWSDDEHFRGTSPSGICAIKTHNEAVLIKEILAIDIKTLENVDQAKWAIVYLQQLAHFVQNTGSAPDWENIHHDID